ncbi:MAG: AarF/ABC1/UbiB kinase family protein [Labilithrix sp.]
MKDEGVPKSRLVRLGKLAALGARTGASLLTSRDGSGAAESATRVLGQMRGLAAKVGQMASYVDGVVPEAHREAYEATLSRLRAAAPTSSFEAVRRTVEEDLEAPLDRLFSSFEEAPFASASIGQVHRATLEDGRAVAVKVQHEGIHEAVEADLSNASVLQSVAGVAAGKFGSKAIFERVRTRFREELDYRIEAKHLSTFRDFHAGDPKIHIPELMVDRSGARVLTTELVRGRTFEEAITDDEASKRAYAETLWRFVFRGNLVLGLFNADPHPGNYLFGEDGVVTFLDFGCCEPLSGAHHSAARRMHAAAIRKDDATFRTHARVLLETKPGRYEDFALDYSRRCFEPLFGSPFRLTRKYAASLVEEAQEMKKLLLQRNANVTPLPAGMVLVNRLQFGFYSVLARFDVEVDYAAVERAFFLDTDWGRELLG